MSKLIIVFLVFGVANSFGRHIHPRHHTRESWKTDYVEIDGMRVDVLRKVAPSGGFVPANNIIFFRKQEPCADGLKRDLFGICREVWDD